MSCNHFSLLLHLLVHANLLGLAIISPYSYTYSYTRISWVLQSFTAFKGTGGGGFSGTRFILHTFFPCYEHAHNIDEGFLTRNYSLLTLRLSHGVNIKRGGRL